jgi:polygalacturonase
MVTSFAGCKGDGTTNCQPGIQQAVNAAERSGGTVYLPAGTYLDTSTTPVTVSGGTGVTIEGANRATTRIVVEDQSHKPTILALHADHVTVANLTFDGSMVTGGGALVAVTASDTTIDDCQMIGGPHTSWPMRFAGGRGTAKPTNPTYATGNVVNDLVLSDDAPSRNDGLDFSFQENGSISDVQQTGSRLGLYVDRNVTVTDYTFTPNPAVGSGAYGYYVTDPSSDITITNFTTSGEGGRIGSIPTANPRGPNSDITIVNERMLDRNFSITIGDVTGLVIRDSQLGKVDIAPTVDAQGVLESSSYSQIVHAGMADSTINVANVDDTAAGT